MKTLQNFLLCLMILSGVFVSLKPSSARTVSSKLVIADYRLACGKLVYRETESMKGDSPFNRSGIIAACTLPDGRYSMNTDIAGTNGSSYRMHEIYDGTDFLRLTNHDEQVQFCRTGILNRETGRMRGIGPGPVFALGRGLSNLRQFQIKGGATSVLLTGIDTDGTSITAKLDPKHEYCAREIILSHEKDVYAVWHLSHLVRLSNGVWVAAHAVYDAYTLSGQISDHKEISLLSRKYRVCRSSDFLCDWQAPGKDIIDSRVVGFPAPEFTSDELLNACGTAPLTSAALLAFSKQSIADQGPLEELLRKQQQQYLIKDTEVLGSVTALATTVLLLGLRGRRKTPFPLVGERV
jgi:hypothetical protein